MILGLLRGLRGLNQLKVLLLGNQVHGISSLLVGWLGIAATLGLASRILKRCFALRRGLRKLLTVCELLSFDSIKNLLQKRGVDVGEILRSLGLLFTLLRLFWVLKILRRVRLDSGVFDLLLLVVAYC